MGQYTGGSFFEIIEHTGDVGVRVWGRTKEELFENAGRAMFCLLLRNADRVQPRFRRCIAVRANALDELMVNWLSELNFNFCTENEVYREFKVLEIDDQFLRAEAHGETFNPEVHEAKIEIKAVTFHQVYVGPRRDGPGWEANVIFDI
ncbi:MAG: archease [candidate division KSB1 bacterium]|nr:archease [candidate division KSB1 bacterium]